MDEKSFVLRRTSLTVSLICNLRCKLCAAYAPYASNREFTSIPKLLEYVRNYFKIVDYVEIFTITGGEPLLYKELPELLDALFKFSDQFGKIEIITNGTIVPCIKLLESIKPYKDKFLRFIVDNYGDKSVSKTGEIRELLTEYNIPFEIREYTSENAYCDGWVDFGSLTEMIHTPAEAEDLFKKCAYPEKLGFCFNIIEGYLIPCPPVYRRWSFGLANENEYIDLMDNSLSVDQQRRKIMAMFSAAFLKTCAYCNGLCDDSPRFVPAEQLPAR